MGIHGHGGLHVSGPLTRHARGGHRVAAVSATLAGLLILTGCSASEESVETAVQEAVLAADTNILDTYMSTSSGLSGRGFWLRIYVEDTSVEPAARSVDAAFEAAYRASPFDPTHITVDIAETPRPADVALTNGSIPIEDAADLLGLPWADSEIRLARSALEHRYGPWESAGD